MCFFCVEMIGLKTNFPIPCFDKMVQEYHEESKGNRGCLSNNCFKRRVKGMPTEIGNQMHSIFNALGNGIMDTMFHYFILPLFIVWAISKYILKISGIPFKAIMFITIFACCYFFSKDGLGTVLRTFADSIRH
jgi:hypothetical protein